MKYLFQIIFFAAIAIVSCEKEEDIVFENTSQRKVVIDCILTNENKEHCLKLSYSSTEMNSNPEMISGAIVIISDGSNVWLMKEKANIPGCYYSDATFATLFNKNYNLMIYHNSNIYTAKAEMVKGGNYRTIKYSMDSKDSLFHITWVSNPYNPIHPSMYEITLDWSQVPGYENEKPDDCRARLLYYSLPTVDVSQIFSPTKENIGFPKGTLITQKRYSVNNEYAAYLRSLLIESQWDGGLFDTEPANLPTNISGGAIGFFTVCEVEKIFLIAGN